MSKLESDIQYEIIQKLEADGWLAKKVITCTKAGYPEVEAVKFGREIKIEVKRPGQQLKKLQAFRKRQLEAHGMEVYVFESANDITKIQPPG